MGYNNDRFTPTRTSTSDLRIVSTIGVTNPVTLEEAKNYLRINNNQDDALITGMITTAILRAERYINSDILSKQRTVYYDFLNEIIHLYYAPIASVDSVVVDGTTLVEDAGYEVRGFENPQIAILYPPAEEITITYTTAGRSADDVKYGILALVAEHYYGRTEKVNTNWKLFLAPFRIEGYYGVR